MHGQVDENEKNELVRMMPMKESAIIAGCGFLTYLLLDNFLHQNKAWIIGISTAVLIFTYRSFLPVHEQKWFKISFTIAILLHIILFFFVKTTIVELRSTYVWPIGLADLVLTIGMIIIIQRLMRYRERDSY